MTGIYARANTPRPIINRLNREIVTLLNRPEIKQRFLDAGLEVVANSPEEFAAFMKTDAAAMSKVIKDAGIKGD
jgi:tripartite-type tricarboxylate transporter receptor subunit TctC